MSSNNFEDSIKNYSNNKLKKLVKSLEKESEFAQKMMTKLDHDTRKLKMVEYNDILDRIDIVNSILKQRDLEHVPTTAEKLFPTVTAIINDHKDIVEETKSDIDIKDDTKIEEEISDEKIDELNKTLEENLDKIEHIDETTIIEENKINNETKKQDLTTENTIKDVTKTASKEKVKTANKKVEVSPPIRPTVFLEEITDDGNVKKVAMNNFMNNFNTDAVQQNLSIDDLLDADVTIDDLMNGIEDDTSDNQTIMLSATKESIIERPVEELDEDRVNSLSDIDAKRDLELTLRMRDVLKAKMKDKAISEELQTNLGLKLDIVNKNINKLNLRVKAIAHAV